MLVFASARGVRQGTRRMQSRLERLVYRPVGCVALSMAALVSGCGGGGPLESDRVFSGDVFSGNHLKPKDYPIHGIDVSKFQGDIDWNAVASSGVKFAWIKATEGGDRADARFQANWEGSKAAGIPHGAYHFVYWCRPPLEEISYFEQNAPVEDDALPPVLDAEATPTSPTCRRHVTQDEAIADMQVMLQEMERHYGKRPIIYTTPDFYEANSFRRRADGLSDLGALDQTPSCREVRHARLAFLAVSIRRPGPGHRGQRRQGRLLRHKGTVGRLPEGAGGAPRADRGRSARPRPSGSSNGGRAAAGVYLRARRRPRGIKRRPWRGRQEGRLPVRVGEGDW